ncbi:hypothetical protein Ntsu_79990 [Nocardia sp. IFM 10818]
MRSASTVQTMTDPYADEADYLAGPARHLDEIADAITRGCARAAAD